MSLVFMDGFGHYSTSQLVNKWTQLNGATIGSNYNRRGGPGLLLNDDTHYLQKTLSAYYSTLYAGFAFKIASFTNNGRLLFGLYETGTLHTDIRTVTNTGQIYATRNGTSLGTSTFALQANVWYHCQVKITIHDSAGAVEVKINGVTVLNLTGVDTRNGGGGTANQIRFGGAYDGGATYICDFWLDDSEYLGDCRIETLLPSAAGAATQWDASAGNNYECVDESSPNSDTDYVSTDTANEIDTYTFGDLTPSSGTVKGVQANVWARKDDAGERSIALLARPGSTDRVGDSKALGDSYNYYQQIWGTNPDTSNPWAISEVNASEFGVKLVA